MSCLRQTGPRRARGCKPEPRARDVFNRAAYSGTLPPQGLLGLLSRALHEFPQLLLSVRMSDQQYRVAGLNLNIA